MVAGGWLVCPQANVKGRDGWSWTVPKSLELALYKPIGVTCEYVYTKGTVAEHFNLARVRLVGPVQEF